MKKTFRQCLAAFAAMVTLAASAPVFAAGFTPSLPIQGIDVGNTGVMILRLGANTECGTPLAIVDSSQPYYKDMVALASMAYTTGQTVTVWVASCNPQNQAIVVRMVIGTVW